MSRKRARKARPKTFNLASRIRSALRKIWLYSPQRKEALEAAYTRTMGKTKYRRCSECLGEFPTKDVAVDHIIPCGTMPGTRNARPEDTLDAFVERLFCPSVGLRVLCTECHTTVTREQRKNKCSN